jgi:hypothetical protein
MSDTLKLIKAYSKPFLKYVKNFNCDEAEYQFDDGLDLNSKGFYCKSRVGTPNFGDYRYTLLNSPVPIEPVLKDYMKELDGQGDIPTEGGEQESWIGTYFFRFIPETNIFQVGGYFTEYADGEEESQTIEINEKETDKDTMDTLSKFHENGINWYETDFHGSGDSGWIEDQGKTNLGGLKLTSKAPAMGDLMYRMLENVAPGWEIDSGAHGNFYYDFSRQKLTLNITLVEESEAEEVFVSHKISE